MGKVKTLRKDVYKKIAAGEVVERPLSVVKELVENSLDAGADNIKVEIIDGGKSLIKITDNGCGFDPVDIETAFKNHSTSKLSELEDFDSLRTLGFRGEALPSIMEVSKIHLQTACTDDGKGISCFFEDGDLREKQDTARIKGTTIEVRELFYNFPVRKKFLKADRTELNQIISFLEPMALVNHDRSFELLHNGKTVFLYKQTGELRERIYQVFGKDFLEALQPVEYQQGEFSIQGFVSRINTGLSVKKHQYFFVNRRSVRERTLIAALNKTFEKFLEKSRNPAAILLLDVPPHQVDVNIHPMKLEIKFQDSSIIYRLIRGAIESTFGLPENYGELPDGAPGGGGHYNYGNYGDNYGGGYGGGTGGYRQDAPGGASAGGTGIGDMNGMNGMGGGGPRPGGGMPMGGPMGGSMGGSMGQAPHPAGGTPDSQARLFDTDFLSDDPFHIIGQYKNSYILVEKDTNLLLVDQHNAQERVNFDQLKKEYGQNSVVSISPLFPVTMELTPSEVSGLDDRKLDLLEKMGFRLESLGGNTYDIKSFPQVLGEKNIKEAVRNVIHLEHKDEKLSFEDRVLAEIACKSAIKVNHRLYPEQMKNIVTNLFNTTNPYFCPHQRPIIIEFTLEQIEKMLKRK